MTPATSTNYEVGSFGMVNKHKEYQLNSSCAEQFETWQACNLGIVDHLVINLMHAQSIFLLSIDASVLLNV